MRKQKVYLETTMFNYYFDKTKNAQPSTGIYLLLNRRRLLIMKLTTDIEYEIDAIRDSIYEKIKDMSPDEETAYFNAIAEETRTKYNLRVVKSALRDTAEAV